MIVAYQGQKNEEGDSFAVTDSLVKESPLTILLNGKSLTVTMQMPGHEIQLAAGILYTEGIIKKIKHDQVKWEWTKDDSNHDVINVLGDWNQPAVNRRSMLSISACGICGKTDFSPPVGDKISSKDSTDFNPLWFDEMRKRQLVFNDTGGTHAAMVINGLGEMVNLFEDIGRHNAVDKCIGDLYLQNRLSEAHWMLVSGRISFEIVTKCFMAGIPRLASVSAPTSLAVDFAKELGVSLFAFCRNSRFTQYA
jgi:FdhD protein